MNRRIAAALDQIGPLEPPIVVLNSGPDGTAIPDAIHVATDAVARDALAAQGVPIAEVPPKMAGTVIVHVARSKPYTRAMIAQAGRIAQARIIVDGAKTDGIDAIWRELRGRVAVQGLSKAHGRCLWFDPARFDDWTDPGLQPGPDGMLTQIGVFSESKVDPGSRSLVQALPDLTGTVADLGAGWGYLSRALLAMKGLRVLHVVEAERRALEAARANLNDARARFHWADATRWVSPEPVDAVVMNPPFHAGRNANPELGIAFIQAAARMLTPRGRLYMVANRHLPYEAPLARHFAQVAPIGPEGAFKLFEASRPLRR